MTPTEVIGIAGLATTLAGAFGGAWLGAVVERRAVDRREMHQQHDAVLRAARLIGADLDTNLRLVDEIAQDGLWKVGDDLQFDAWAEGAGPLALGLPADDFALVRYAITQLRRLDGRASAIR